MNEGLSAASLLPDKLLGRLWLLSLKESLSHIPLPHLLGQAELLPELQKQTSRRGRGKPNNGGHGIKHKYINIKKNVMHFAPVKS